MDKFDANRRKLLALGGVALGAAILPTPAFATLSTPRPRILTLNNLHTGESIKAEFFDGRVYIQEELAKLNHFFRDYRANKIKSIDPGLFDQLYRLQGLLGTRKPVQLISGYRSIDTAQAYYNEEGVGNAVRKCGVPREELFITTKVWISNGGYEKAKASIDESLRKLQSDYVDLLLIHQPFNDYYGTYRAMEEAYKAGKARAIGVSNFYPDRFIDLAEFCEIKPAVNQVETHVFNQQVKPQEIMKKYDTKVMSWGPFAEGRNNFFSNEVLKAIGEQYGKSVAQVALRFLIQRDIIVIPKSTRKERMIENFDVFDFTGNLE